MFPSGPGQTWPGERMRELGFHMKDFKFEATARMINRGELPTVHLNDVIGLPNSGSLLDGVKVDSWPSFKIQLSQEGEQEKFTPNNWWAGERAVGKRISAVMFEKSSFGTIQYRVHIQRMGWSQWVENGQWAGNPKSTSFIEAIQVRLPHDRM